MLLSIQDELISFCGVVVSPLLLTPKSCLPLPLEDKRREKIVVKRVVRNMESEGNRGEKEKERGKIPCPDSDPNTLLARE